MPSLTLVQPTNMSEHIITNDIRRVSPVEIEKQKKKKKRKKKVIRANFKLFHLYFATFLVENIIFSSLF